MKIYYKAKQIFYQNELIFDQYLIVDEGKFVGLSSDLPEDVELVDYGEAIISPGFVETHIHGYDGSDVMDNDPNGLQTMAQGLLRTGTTSWLPTTLTDSKEHLAAVCQTIAENYQTINGAKIQGIFLEGPFFTEKYKGAQNLKYMGDPSIEILNEWQAAAKGLVKKIAIAPERQGVAEFVDAAVAQGIVVALAHSDARLDQAESAVDHGASIFVHTFNGMRGLHHREPGMVGAALSLDQVYAEAISDGLHVHPAALKIIFKARGPKEMILITDAMRATGLGDGMSKLGEFEVEVKDGAARLVEGGNLAGSVLEMNQAIKNMLDWQICNLAEALEMATLTPAKSVGIEHQCGIIAPERAADFVVLDDQMHVLATYIDGRVVYQA